MFENLIQLSLDRSQENCSESQQLVGKIFQFEYWVGKFSFINPDNPVILVSVVVTIMNTTVSSIVSYYFLSIS